MTPHVHCPRCSYPVEIPEQDEYMTPGYTCQRCGREVEPLTFEEAGRVSLALGLLR